jgi:hypothetical protein
MVPVDMDLWGVINPPAEFRDLIDTMLRDYSPRSFLDRKSQHEKKFGIEGQNKDDF